MKGKIVLCGSISDGTKPFLAGAKGAVMLYPSLDGSYSFPLWSIIPRARSSCNTYVTPSKSQS